MPLNFQFEFSYLFEPVITIRVRSTQTGLSQLIRAQVDTGADRTIMDSRIAASLGLNLRQGLPLSLMGLGGSVEAVVLELELVLLDEAELSVTMPVAFAESQASTVGNLIGLDVLEHFDFGLSHRERLGYLGRAHP